MPKRLLIIAGLALMMMMLSCAKRSTEYQEESWLTLEREIPVVGNALDIHVDDNTIYVAQDQGGISIIQRNNYSSKWYTTLTAEDGSQAPLGRIKRISAIPEYNRLFLNEVSATDRIVILNTADPDTLVYMFDIIGGTSGIKDLDATAMAEPEGMFTMNIGYCYADGFKYDKYDGSILSTPAYSVAPPATAMGFDLTDDLILVTAGQRGLFIYDRASQQYKSELALPGEAQKVVVAGNLALIPSRQAGLCIVSFADPVHPALLSTFDTSGYATSVDFSGDKVAVSSGSGGVYLLDISDPANPTLLEHLTSCGYSNVVKFADDKLVVGTRDQGVLIYKLR